MLPNPESDSNSFSEYDFTKIPFEKIVHFGQRTLLNRDLFVVSWLLGRYCNYRCSYCWPYARADKPDHRSLDLILKTINEIKRQARARKFNSFHFSFSGGEPTMHPNYLEILRHLSSNGPACNYQSVHMTTNLSQPTTWFEKYIHATSELHRVSITASFHKEFAKKETFAKKLLFLMENDIHVTINMVMAPARFEMLWDEAQFFHKEGINVTLKPQSNANATQIVEGYSADQLERLQKGLPQVDYTFRRLASMGKESVRPKQNQTVASAKDTVLMQVQMTDEAGQKWYLDQAERINSFGFNSFLGWECSAGYRSIIIREPDGMIKRSYSCADKPLGNIETGFSLFENIMPCMTRSCVSSADNKIPKRKTGSRIPLWPERHQS